MTYSIYALSDPSTGIVHYIGISSNVQRRYKEHCTCSGTNLQKNIWIQQLLQKNQQPTLSILDAVQDRKTALEREKAWIHHYASLGLLLTNWNENEQARDGGIRIDNPELNAYALDKIAKGRLVKKARHLIEGWSKPTRENHFNKGWEGVAPSYLCTELEIDYDEACALLLDLQAEGFIYDNKHGNYHELEDGRTCPTRFYMGGIRK